MNLGRSVFAQLISFLPDREFRRCVNRYDGDRRWRGFSCWDQFLCMAFAQLGTIKLSSLAAFSPPAAAAKSLIPSLRFSGTLPQNGLILLNLTVPDQALQVLPYLHQRMHDGHQQRLEAFHWTAEPGFGLDRQVSSSEGFHNAMLPYSAIPAEEFCFMSVFTILLRPGLRLSLFSESRPLLPDEAWVGNGHEVTSKRI